jgi:hypothetical protein
MPRDEVSRREAPEERRGSGGISDGIDFDLDPSAALPRPRESFLPGLRKPDSRTAWRSDHFVRDDATGHADHDVKGRHDTPHGIALNAHDELRRIGRPARSQRDEQGEDENRANVIGPVLRR